jgi:xanthine dehydrogenase accessory factor
MKDFYQLLTTISQHHEKSFAMATIINVRGSAYRQTGAKMLFMEGGEQFCTLSAGCLEEDLHYHASEVILTGKSKRVTYNLMSEDDLSWGHGAGCNGEIDVLVEPFKWGTQWNNAMTKLDNGQQIISIKSLEENNEKIYLFPVDGSWISEKEDTDILTSHVEDFLRTGKQLMIIKIEEWNRDFIFEKIESRDSLYIFGAGPDVEPVAQLADRMNFAVTIIDPRSSRCNWEHFPSAAELVVEHPESYLKMHCIPRNSYVLSMTHSFERDRSILMELLGIKPKFLGVLGPRRRSVRLVSPHELPEWVQSPVGVEIGAEGPEEISVSIVAQLLQVRNCDRIAEKGKRVAERNKICSL